MKKIYQITTPRLFLLILCLTAITTGCDVSETQNIDSPDWQLVWSDEFDGDAGSSPDSTNWRFDIGTGENGWGNQELQYYTDRPENIAQDGEGNLVITARSENFRGSGFTSARINTKDLFEQAYGRIEARLITPFGPGIWPAFWMLGENFDEVGWPQTGEIDIMELRGQQPNIVLGSLHGPGFSGGNAITKPFGLQQGRFDTDYHIYAVEWFPDRIDYFVDDFLYQRITKEEVEDAGGEWVFDKPFFLLMNVAVGGTFVGFPSQETPFPQQMTIDYVRVYSQ